MLHGAKRYESKKAKAFQPHTGRMQKHGKKQDRNRHKKRCRPIGVQVKEPETARIMPYVLYLLLGFGRPVFVPKFWYRSLIRRLVLKSDPNLLLPDRYGIWMSLFELVDHYR